MDRFEMVEPDSAGCFRLLFALGIIGSILFAFLFLPLIGHTHHRRSARAKCSNNLRQFGLAAITYADDKRFYPHVGSLTEFHGGYDTNHTPRIVRALSYYGYHDNPEGWICPSSYDQFVPISDDAVRENQRLWFWNGGALSGTTTNPLVGRQADPTLRETGELSYGWTRRGMSSNARSSAILASDRAVLHREEQQWDHLLPGELGNHSDGVNVLRVDAAVEYLPTIYESLEERLANVDVLESSLNNPPRSTDSRWRVPKWLALLPFYGTPAALLAWFWYMGYRRRVLFVGKRGLVRKRARWLTADVLGTGPSTLGAPELNAKGKPKVTLSASQRCPFCLESAAESDDLVACRACGTLLHRECVQEGGTCSTLGCKNQRRV